MKELRSAQDMIIRGQEAIWQRLQESDYDRKDIHSRINAMATRVNELTRQLRQIDLRTKQISDRVTRLQSEKESKHWPATMHPLWEDNDSIEQSEGGND